MNTNGHEEKCRDGPGLHLRLLVTRWNGLGRSPRGGSPTDTVHLRHTSKRTVGRIGKMRASIRPASRITLFLHAFRCARSSVMLRLNGVKTRATFRYRAMIVLLCFGIGGGAHAAGAVQDLLERIKEQLPRKEQQTGPKSMTLDGGIRAETAVFRETTWQLKTVPQIASLSFIRADAEAMKLP